MFSLSSLGGKLVAKIESSSNATFKMSLKSSGITSDVKTSWSLLGPGVEVGLTPSFIDYAVSLSSRVVLLLQH